LSSAKEISKLPSDEKGSKLKRVYYSLSCPSSPPVSGFLLAIGDWRHGRPNTGRHGKLRGDVRRPSYQDEIKIGCSLVAGLSVFDEVNRVRTPSDNWRASQGLRLPGFSKQRRGIVSAVPTWTR